jgi:hypothetical protein
VDGRAKPGHDEGVFGNPGNFFIPFVDRIFTTFIERPFTNAFDRTREIAVKP